MILGLQWWAFCLLCLVPFILPVFTCILDSSNSNIHKAREWKRMNVGDKYVKAYYSEKKLNKHQQGHRMYAIITKKEGEKPNEWKAYYDIYLDDKYDGKGSMKIRKSMLKFFDNWRRPDDFSCIVYQWCRRYKGNGYY